MMRQSFKGGSIRVLADIFTLSFLTCIAAMCIHVDIAVFKKLNSVIGEYGQASTAAKKDWVG
jgi:hypothetical protein